MTAEDIIKTFERIIRTNNFRECFMEIIICNASLDYHSVTCPSSPGYRNSERIVIKEPVRLVLEVYNQTLYFFCVLFVHIRNGADRTNGNHTKTPFYIWQ